MSEPGQRERESEPPGERASVLASLPSTRPQRVSARRAASRAPSPRAARAQGNGAAPASGSTADGSRGSRKTAARGGQRSPSRASAARAGGKGRGASRVRRAEPAAAPRQGYECERDAARGTVQPPGGTELIASAFEIFVEVTKSGVSSTERLLKDVFSRLAP